MLGCDEPAHERRFVPGNEQPSRLTPPQGHRKDTAASINSRELPVFARPSCEGALEGADDTPGAVLLRQARGALEEAQHVVHVEQLAVRIPPPRRARSTESAQQQSSGVDGEPLWIQCWERQRQRRLSLESMPDAEDDSAMASIGETAPWSHNPHLELEPDLSTQGPIDTSSCTQDRNLLEHAGHALKIPDRAQLATSPAPAARAVRSSRHSSLPDSRHGSIGGSRNGSGSGSPSDKPARLLMNIRESARAARPGKLMGWQPTRTPGRSPPRTLWGSTHGSLAGSSAGSTPPRQQTPPRASTARSPSPPYGSAHQPTLFDAINDEGALSYVSSRQQTSSSLRVHGAIGLARGIVR